ncbi:MAG: SUMF1/EgtB/PvdO family nonheme iron enzyme [bacterium]|nr:SUMF1/EgtB/PvdO family nonheme iron enzyme [bacterium]
MKKLITLFFVLCVAAFSTSATAGVGDVNADGSVNVSDVTALVNQIIGSGSYSAQACDVNADGEVNVSDVTALVNLIINGGGESENPNPTFTVNGVSFEMVKVEGGVFTMGATSEQGGDAANYEKPTHKVTLSSYYIGKTEVTQELWEAVMGKSVSQIASENRLSTYGVGSKNPMYYISWNDCQEFVTKLNELTGKKFRLPTEAEWEYAARGGNKSKGYKYSGSNTIDDVAWYTDNSNSTTQPVGTKAPNELGIYDMSGNVWEWCNDWKGDYSSSSQYNPTGPNSGSCRVYRGGTWSNTAWSCRVSNRNDGTPSLRYNSLGLRLALDVNQTFSVNGVSFDMIAVEGGTFTMGATEEQGSDAKNNEKPTHQVTLSSYFIGKTEVTQALWEAVMGSNPMSISKGANFPVGNVTWEDCQEFITKLNELTGKKFRLPTEAEWEYAARGGNKSQGYKYSGSNTINDVAWYSSNSGRGLQNVATKSPNELGIYDMSGNALEWCSDWFGSYSSDSQSNPIGPDSGSYRVCRGGSYGDDAKYCRVSYRDLYNPASNSFHLGLRLCLSE